MDIRVHYTFISFILLFIYECCESVHQDYETELTGEDHMKDVDSHHKHLVQVDSVAVSASLCLRLRSGQITENELVESCLNTGYKFLKKYIRLERVRKSHGNSKCNLFSRFRSCFLSIYSKCSHDDQESGRHSADTYNIDTGQTHSRNFKHDLLEIWHDVINHVDCLCNSKSDCSIDQSCMFGEVDGFWGRVCEDFYKFNIEQKTNHQCHFFEENMQCKIGLVSSGCNEVTGKFARSLLHLIAGNETHRLKCQEPSGRERYKVFSYSEGCSTRLIQEIDNCSALFTRQNIVEFHEDNDLIPHSNKKVLKIACRTVETFDRCLQPLREVCPVGVQRVLDYQEDLRRYLLKMNYICQETVYEDFKQDLKCYQTLMRNSSLKQCSGMWMAVRPWQQDITSYQFYCQPTHQNTVNLIRELSNVRDCHSDVFRHRCGDRAAHYMRDLFNLAFRDPFYLRLTYKPDCALHHPVTTTPNPNHIHRTSPADARHHFTSPSISSSSSLSGLADTDDVIHDSSTLRPFTGFVTERRNSMEVTRSDSSTILYRPCRTCGCLRILLLFTLLLSLYLL